MKKVRIIVSGRVQGVFFRKYTLEKAKELGLKGEVKNQQDKSVLIIVAGENWRVDKMIEWCHKGSPLSRVEQVKVQLLEGIASDYHEFSITH